MAKLLFLVLLCFQFSRPEELTGYEKLENELEAAFNKDSSELLDGADENQWSKPEYTKTSDEWTEEDEKWFENIQNLLKESDEDSDDDNTESVIKLISDIEKWIEKTHPEKSHYQWLVEIGEWLDVDDEDWDLSDYPDYAQKEELSVGVDKNKDLDVYYSWLYKMKLGESKNKQKRSLMKTVKRFSSV